MAGLTPEGLEIKRLEQVIESLRNTAVTLFQDLVPPGDNVDTSSSTALGRLIGLVAPQYSELWETSQQVYSAFDPNFAEGVALDALVSIAGIARFDAVATSGYLTLSGVYQTTVPEDSVISASNSGVRFNTQASVILNEEDATSVTLSLSSVSNTTLYQIVVTDGVISRTFTFTSDGTALQQEILEGLRNSVISVGSSFFSATIDSDTITIFSINPLSGFDYTLTGPLQFEQTSKIVQIVAQETGPNEQAAGSVNTIQTPVLGWEGVSNPYSLTVGRNRETDSELRNRFRDSKYVRGSNLMDSLYSDLIALDGVDKAIIIVNDTDSTSSEGLPPHSFSALVEGGTSQDIGEIIWSNKPAGIASYGDTSVDVVDVQGETQQVNFARPSYVSIYIDIDITTDNTFPPDGEQQIKNALVSYFRDNFSIGDDVIYSRLYTPINSVTGFQVNTLYVDDESSPEVTTNVAIAYNEIANLEQANINISLT